MSETLLPCPCCGNVAKVIHECKPDGRCSYKVAFVRCSACVVRTADYIIDGYYGSTTKEEDAVAAWNRRAEDERHKKCPENENSVGVMEVFGLEIKFENESQIKSVSTTPPTARSNKKSFLQMKWVLGDVYNNLRWYQNLYLRLWYTIQYWMLPRNYRR